MLALPDGHEGTEQIVHLPILAQLLHFIIESPDHFGAIWYSLQQYAALQPKM